MIRIGLDPDMFDLGPVPVTWVGFFTMAGVAVGVLLVLVWGRKRGLAVGQLYGAALWAVLGGFVGARALHALDFWGFYQALPLRVFYIWSCGLALWGAILGGALGGLLYAWRHGMPVRRVADLAALAALVGQAVGRFGDVLVGERLARGTSWPWGIVYTHRDSVSYASPEVARHPVAAYELLWDVAVFALLWRLRPRLRPEGSVFVSYLGLYAVGRLLVGFVLLDKVWWLGLGEAQVVGLGVLALAAVAFWLWPPRLVAATTPPEDEGRLSGGVQ